MKRSPNVAVLLTFFSVGLGHLYSGHLVKGLALFFLGFLLLPVAVLGAAYFTGTTAYLGLAPLALAFLVFVYAVLDARRLARRAPEPYALREYNRPAVYAIFLVAGSLVMFPMVWFVREELYAVYTVPQGSMSPTLQPGDRFLVNKRIVRETPLERGDVVIYRVTHEGARKNFVKRVIGLPGDVVEVRGGRVLLNGRELAYEGDGPLLAESIDSRSWRISIDDPRAEGVDHPPVTVPPGCCWVLGDNRSGSLDSRKMGPVPLVDVVGVAELLVIPAGDWGRFGPIDPS